MVNRPVLQAHHELAAPFPSMPIQPMAGAQPTRGGIWVAKCQSSRQNHRLKNENVSHLITYCGGISKSPGHRRSSPPVGWGSVHGILYRSQSSAHECGAGLAVEETPNKRLWHFHRPLGWRESEKHWCRRVLSTVSELEKCLPGFPFFSPYKGISAEASGEDLITRLRWREACVFQEMLSFPEVSYDEIQLLLSTKFPSGTII